MLPTARRHTRTLDAGARELTKFSQGANYSSRSFPRLVPGQRTQPRLRRKEHQISSRKIQATAMSLKRLKRLSLVVQRNGSEKQHIEGQLR